MLPPKWGSSDRLNIAPTSGSTRPREQIELVRVQLPAPAIISATAIQERQDVAGNPVSFDQANFVFRVGCGGVMTEYGLYDSNPFLGPGVALQANPQGVYQFTCDYLSVSAIQNPFPQDGAVVVGNFQLAVRAYAAPVPFGYSPNPTVARNSGNIAAPVSLVIPYEPLRKLWTAFNDTTVGVNVTLEGGTLVRLGPGEYFESNYNGQVSFSSAAGGGVLVVTRQF